MVVEDSGMHGDLADVLRATAYDAKSAKAHCAAVELRGDGPRIRRQSVVFGQDKVIRSSDRDGVEAVSFMTMMFPGPSHSKQVVRWEERWKAMAELGDVKILRGARQRRRKYGRRSRTTAVGRSRRPPSPQVQISCAYKIKVEEVQTRQNR